MLARGPPGRRRGNAPLPFLARTFVRRLAILLQRGVKLVLEPVAHILSEFAAHPARPPPQRARIVLQVSSLRQIVEIVNSGAMLRGAEKAQAQQIAASLGKLFCRRCGYCQPCPQGVPITNAMVFEGFLRRFPVAVVIVVVAGLGWPKSWMRCFSVSTTTMSLTGSWAHWANSRWRFWRTLEGDTTRTGQEAR